MSEDIQDYGIAVIAKAWADPDFRRRFVDDPRAALKADFDIEVPEDVRITVHEETTDSMHFVLPTKPAEMSDADLVYDELRAAGGFRALGYDVVPNTGSATSNWVSCCKPA